MEQPQVPKKKSRKKLIAVIVIVIIVVFVVAIALAGGSKKTIVANGTVENLSGSQYYSIEFTVSSSTTIYGSESATNGVTFYLMTPSEYASLASSGTASSYVYTSGTISSGSFNTNINSGTYYAVFMNPHTFSSTTVTINDLYVQ